jgi:hypothetical protein
VRRELVAKGIPIMSHEAAVARVRASDNEPLISNKLWHNAIGGVLRSQEQLTRSVPRIRWGGGEVAVSRVFRAMLGEWPRWLASVQDHQQRLGALAKVWRADYFMRAGEGLGHRSDPPT